MADMAVSAVERALENQRIGSLQIRVAIFCGLVQVCDGYDLNAIAWAAPSLIKTWGLTPPAFTAAFLWSSIGIMIGALSAGPLGDRFGRKPLLLASLTIFGVASLLSAFAGSLGILAVLRFFTGVGIGGGFSLFLKDGKPTYTYNYFGQSTTTISAPDPLPPGHAKIVLKFDYEGGGRGKGAGQLVASD